MDFGRKPLLKNCSWSHRQSCVTLTCDIATSLSAKLPVELCTRQTRRVIRVNQPPSAFPNIIDIIIQMLPRLPTIRLLPPETIKNPFICLSCRYRRALSIAARASEPQWPSTLQRPSHLRKASTVSPVTTVNAAKQIPPAARELYEALGILREEAGVYSTLSELLLALNGIESQNAVSRVACENYEAYRSDIVGLMLDSTRYKWSPRG